MASRKLVSVASSSGWPPPVAAAVEEVAGAGSGSVAAASVVPSSGLLGGVSCSCGVAWAPAEVVWEAVVVGGVAGCDPVPTSTDLKLLPVV